MSQTSQQSSPSTVSGGGTETSESKTADVAGAAQEQVAQAAGQVQEKAQEAAGQIQDRLREQIDQRSSQAAEQIKQQGSDLRSVGESLRQQGKEGPARAADRLAGYAEKVGGYLGEKDSYALLSDAEDFGRRQPWAVAAGGLVLGFAASRFLKASSRERYQSHPSRRPGPPALTRETSTQAASSPFVGPRAVEPGAAPGGL